MRVYQILKSYTSIAAVVLLLTTTNNYTAKANEEYLCTEGPDGQQECQAVTFDTDIYDEVVDQEEIVDDGVWRASLAVEQCTDRNPDCKSLAESDQCNTNPGYMKYNCPVSCNTCDEFDQKYQDLRDGKGNGPCTDKYLECNNWGNMGECHFNPNFMSLECERSCMVCFEDTNQFGVHQELPHENDEQYIQTKQAIDKSIEYMKRLWKQNPDNNRINYKCRNMHELCSFWSIDECGDNDPNRDYMQNQCAPACQTCHLLDSQLRCPIEEGNESVFKPGDLNTLMENIVDNADGSGDYLIYNPIALSRPKIKLDGSVAPGVEKDGPWVVLLENFISDKEADALIAAGYKKGFERSSDVGAENPDGTHEEDVSEGRTSENAWCDFDLCEKDPITGPVVERIAAATNTNINNSEHLQLLRYEPGQYYKQHHDYIEYQQDLPCGVRMMTLFLYLNAVEEGGGTRFPLLDITVQPKKGHAVLWPSVLDSNPEAKDGRTDHDALPVTKGIKYGANAWIHSRDYREAEKNDCA